MIELLQKLTRSESSILLLGSKHADLLQPLHPSRSLVIEPDPNKVAQAKDQHPDLDIEVGNEELAPRIGPFDYVLILENVIRWEDIHTTLESYRRWVGPETQLIFTLPNVGLQWLKSHSSKAQNWVSKQDLRNLLKLADFKIDREGSFRWSPYLVASAAPRPQARKALTCSVIIPTRNEVGNIDSCVSRVPQMGAGTEIVFVDGSSTDGTVEAIERAIGENPDKNIRLIHQLEPTEEFSEATQRELNRVHKLGKMLPQGKADAVRKGFRAATGDVLMILDADLTVVPEDLPRFFEQIATGRGDFINGVRLLYPQEEQAMQPVNLLGNTFFGFALSWLMGQTIKDSLCGTKVFFKKDYDAIMRIEETLGDFDPFGDFELLFGAAKARLRIVDFPVHYGRRVAGQPKIETYRHGLKLFRMLWYGFLLFKVRQ